VRDKPYDLQFTVLEPLVLEDLLDGDVATLLRRANESGLEDDAKGPITEDFAICVVTSFWSPDLPSEATTSTILCGSSMAEIFTPFIGLCFCSYVSQVSAQLPTPSCAPPDQQ